jgi:hypothetical protein
VVEVTLYRPAGCTEIETAFTATSSSADSRGMGSDVVSAPASPWQNPYVERLIGSIRREYLDHVIVINKAHLRRVLTTYGCFTIIGAERISGLEKDTPDHRLVAGISTGPIVAIPVASIIAISGAQSRCRRPPCTSVRNDGPRVALGSRHRCSALREVAPNVERQPNAADSPAAVGVLQQDHRHGEPTLFWRTTGQSAQKLRWRVSNALPQPHLRSIQLNAETPLCHSAPRQPVLIVRRVLSTCIRARVKLGLGRLVTVAGVVIVTIDRARAGVSSTWGHWV